MAVKGGVLDQLMAELSASRGGSQFMPGQKAFTAGAGFPSGVASNPYQGGPGGLWGVAGIERDIISTRVEPRSLAGMIPARGTNNINPLYPFITGFQAPTGTNPATPCDDPMTAGPIKNCLTTAAFGRYTYKTREIDATRMGQIINRGEFQDLYVVNEPLFDASQGGDLTQPQIPAGKMAVYNEMLVRMTELGVAFQNKLIQQVWQGNPTNNNSGGGYAEFPGLDILIATGHKDAQSGVTCPSLDSYIRDLNYARVDANGQTLINELTYAYRYIKHNADRMNMMPVQWVIAMREELFYEVSQVWACSYATYRCNNTNMALTQAEMFVNSTDVIELRDQMRNGQFLIIDGQHVPVVFDDGIHEDSNTNNSKVTSGCFASDIYFIPLTARGGFACTYWEYFDFSGPNAMFSSDGLGSGVMPVPQGFFWTDGGRYAWHVQPPVNWCLVWLSVVEPRLVFRTPHLAARIKNVQYCPLTHTRTPFNTDNYFVNGGNTTGRPAPSLFAEWSTSSPFL